jgi:branched-chain amino acid transport system permease protein
MAEANQAMRLHSVLIGWGLALLVLLLPVLLFKSQYLLYLSSLTCIYMIVACGLNIVLGYAGQISLAQAGFLGIGAYVCALLGPTLSFWVALPLAGLICFVIGLGLGFPSLRVKTHFLAMVTLGFTVIVYLILVNEEKWTGGP